MDPVVALEMLPADYGDALYLRYGEGQEQHHLLIDGGLAKSFQRGWRPRVRQLGQAGIEIDLLIGTHIDIDHINGVRAFVEANQAGRRPPSLIPVREVWFNQYRHIRPYGDDESAPRGAPSATPHWPTRDEFVAEVAARDDRLGRLARRLAERVVSPPAGIERGIDEGHQLAGLLEGRYLSNTRFDDAAVVREDIPPRVELPGGAVAWILSPTPRKLARLCDEWTAYLRANHLDTLVQVRGRGPMGEGDALVPGFIHELMLRERSTFETSQRGRDADLAVPIEELAQRDFEEDSSLANGSSIALLFEYAGRRLLLTGDAHPNVLAEGLSRLGYSAANPLALDAFKLAHHGSRANTSPELLGMLRCSRYLISTNGDKFGHPDKECLARIIWAGQGGPEMILYCNYDTTAVYRALAAGDDQARYGFRLVPLRRGEALELPAI